jgi:hypothetical protein
MNTIPAPPAHSRWNSGAPYTSKRGLLNWYKFKEIKYRSLMVKAIIASTEIGSSSFALLNPMNMNTKTQVKTK